MSQPNIEFDHERLEVYHLSTRFLALAIEIASNLPRGHSYLADQLRRAATSIVLNIAEGAEEFAKAEKRRFYRMAKRSGAESAAILDIARMIMKGSSEKFARARELLHRIISILIKLAR